MATRGRSRSEGAGNSRLPGEPQRGHAPSRPSAPPRPPPRACCPAAPRSHWYPAVEARDWTGAAGAAGRERGAGARRAADETRRQSPPALHAPFSRRGQVNCRAGCEASQRPLTAAAAPAPCAPRLRPSSRPPSGACRAPPRTSPHPATRRPPAASVSARPPPALGQLLGPGSPWRGPRRRVGPREGGSGSGVGPAPGVLASSGVGKGRTGAGLCARGRCPCGCLLHRSPFWFPEGARRGA